MPALHRLVLSSGIRTVRPITRWGEHVMHRMQEPVTVFDERSRCLDANASALRLFCASREQLMLQFLSETVLLTLVTVTDDLGQLAL